MADSKNNDSNAGGPAKIIILAVAACIISAVFLVLLLGNDNERAAPAVDPGTAGFQGSTDDTEADSESAANPATEDGQNLPADSSPAMASESAVSSNETVRPEPPVANLDDRLPDDWDQLSSQAKTAANPHRCYEGSVIRSDNGRCVVPGTSINYVLLVPTGPQSYVPGLVRFQRTHFSLGVPDNTSEADMDKLFEFFKSTPTRRSRANIPPDEYLGIPADIRLYQLAVYYYSDFRFVDNDVAWGGVDFVDPDNPRREYLTHPRHYFRATVFAAYTDVNDSEKASRVYIRGRSGLPSPTSCEQDIDVVLFYRSGEIDWADPALAEELDVIHYYGPPSPTAADFRAAIVDAQGKLQPKFRREILMSVGLAGITAGPEANIQYDILLKFYRYDSSKGDNLDLYDSNDIFIPDIHVRECPHRQYNP